MNICATFQQIICLPNNATSMDLKYIFEFRVLKQIGNTKQFSEIAS